MSRLWIERALWIGGVFAFTYALMVWYAATPAPPVHRATAFRPLAHGGSMSADSIANLAARVVDSDPFRVARQPAAVAYHPDAVDAAVAQAAPKAPKPPLAISGIVGGPPWAALLDGVPGRDGEVLIHPGDSVSGVWVRAISGNAVVLMGMDTTWRLSLKRPWP